MENTEAGAGEINEGFQSINDRPKENAAEITAIKSKRGSPKFDRDKVIKIVMASLGVLVVTGVVITNIQKRAEETASESGRANSVNMPEEFRRRSLAAGQNAEGAGEDSSVQEAGAEEDIEAEVYGYLPGYSPPALNTPESAAPPPPRPQPPAYPSAPSSGVASASTTGGGRAVVAAVSPPPPPDPALNAKLIPQVEGNGSVYSAPAAAVPQINAGGIGAVYEQAMRGLQGAAYPQYTAPVQYNIPPQPAAPYGQQPAMPYGQQPAAPNELNQQGYQAQNMQNDKQQFYDGGGGAGGGGVINNGYYLGEDTLWNGTIIPAVLVTGVNTDLPGEVMARVSQNIYDSLNGKHLLIPQGTILMARYNSSVSYAQGRVQIIWNTLTRPDGYQIELGGMNGVDDRGMSGQQGEYHENWFQYLKAAGIITMFTLANGEMSRAAGAAAANADIYAANQNIVNQLAGNITARALNIQPTITVKSGEKINVMLNKAVYLPPVEGYKPTERYRR
jgi:type IV secretory pathway VirB10-like protein